MAVCHFGSRTRVAHFVRSKSEKFCPPSPPCRVMAPLTDLTKGFKAILARAGTPDDFEKWLKSKKLWHPMDLYLLAVDETRIDTKIIQVCKSAVANTAEPAVEVSIRKAWLYCKDSVKDPKADEKKEFDPNECTTLDAAWESKYSLKLTTRERVGKSLLKKLHCIAHSQPPDFEIIMLEQISLYSMCSTSVQQVKVTGDGSMFAQQQVVSAVTTAHSVIDRITALLYSFAYVAADLDDWCLLDDARECVQEIWAKMQHSEKHQAPVSFYNDAYIATCQVWQTHIVTCGGTLSTAMQNKAGWVPFWDYRCQGCPQCPGWKRGKGGKGAAFQAVESSNRQQRRALQDAVFKTMERFGRTQGFGAGKGGKSGGKSGGKNDWTKGKGKKETRKPFFDKSKGSGSKGKGKNDWWVADKDWGKDKKKGKGWY